MNTNCNAGEERKWENSIRADTTDRHAENQTKIAGDTENPRITCDVIMDLVAVYKDGIASPDTRKLVRAHLRTCPVCRQMYAGYRAAQEVRPAAALINEHPMPNYVTLARRIHRRQLQSNTAMLSALAVVSAFSVWSIFKLVSFMNCEDMENDK